MNRLPSETEQGKNTGVVWILNLLFPGVGNLYASGNNRRGCYPVLISLALLFVLHWWGWWPVLYLVLSLYGMGEVEAYNRRIRGTRHGEGAHGRRAVNSDLNQEWSEHASGHHAGDGNHSPTSDMRRKLVEAELEMLKRHENGEPAVGSQVVDDQVRRWLEKKIDDGERNSAAGASTERQGGRTQARHTPPPVTPQESQAPARQAAAQSAAQPPASQQAQAQPTAVSYAAQAAPPVVSEPQAAEAKPPDAGGFVMPSGLGETNYQPYVLPTLAPELSAGLSGSGALPSYYSDGTGLPGTDASGGETVSAAGSDRTTCNRCGAPCEHDFSFCLKCGHSYALS